MRSNDDASTQGLYQIRRRNHGRHQDVRDSQERPGYEVGDKIVFDVVTNEGYAVGEAARHPLNGATYRIDYILDDFEGLAQKYVALAISKEDER